MENWTNDQVGLMTWWYDEYLPKCTVDDYWNSKKRATQKFTDTWTHVDQEGNESQKVLITTAMEAFGIFNLDNCRDKWINICMWKDANGWDEKLPVLNKESDPLIVELYRAKYTVPDQGKIKFGGWTEDTYQVFQAYQDRIAAIRAANKESEALQTKVLELMQNKYGVEQAKKKQKKRKPVAVAPPAERKVRRLDE